ncbi:Dapper 1, partial [Buceros rhinoceros silvestris]
NCLRRRDAGLLNQLQELDKQISDLRLDVEKTTDEHLETDSRPSSGFYELSDGASGSLSNSSNSVFSECLSSCHSSTCFCSPLEATLNISDGRPKSADLIGWMDYNKEGQHEDQTAGSVCRSLSTPHSNSLDVVADVHPKYQCDLVSKNGNDVYRYPSPLHAVAVQSPMFLLPVTENPQREEERLGCDISNVCAGSETDSGKSTNTFLPQGSWSAPCPSTSKRIDGYILSLVQKKTHAVRTNKPRTSLNADPTKGILRHGSMCVRQPAGVVAHGNVVNLKSSKQVCLPTGGTAAPDHEGSSSQSLDDGLLVNAQYIPAQQQSVKLHKGTRNVKILKSSVLKHRPHLANGLENGSQTLREKTKPVGKKCRFPDELDTNKKLKKPSSRGKRGSDRRWKSSAEISYEEALRRARRNRREGVGVYSQVPLPYVSPYAYVASDSEYSAECESLFHSTVVDTSEDEQSNYTTNCFGDSESSLSDSDESGGLIWSQFVQTLPIQTVTAPELHENAAKAFVKIKASHNLKKKILRFRSGSLKLMTTV